MSDIKISEELKNEIKAELREEIKESLRKELTEEIKKELEEERKNKKKFGFKREEVKAEEEAKPIEETKAEEEAKPIEETKAEEEAKPIEETKAEEEAKPVEETKAEEEAKPVEETKAEEEAKPVEETKAEEEKKGLTFKKAMWIYVAIWIVITLIVSIYLWSSMAGYQKNYDAAKAAANPDLVAQVVLSDYKYDKAVEIAKASYENVNVYETDEDWQNFFKSAYDDNSLSYNRVENFSETNPQYQVYAGDVLVGDFKLTETGDADKYGFHNYELKSSELLLELPELKDYKIEVLAGSTVKVNGNEISNVVTAEKEKVSDSVHDKAVEKTGIDFTEDVYELTGFINEPEVTVVNGGKDIKIAVEDNIFANLSSYDDEFIDSVKDRILAADTNYIKVMNLVTGFNNISVYLVQNGEAYKAIQSAMSGLSWAGAPEEFEIKNSEIKELWQYDDNTFVVVTHHNIHRVYRGETYDEEMTIENMYVNLGGIWYIQEMALKR